MSIFTLPVIQRNAGDKLYFFQTGTSTPQDVFTTQNLGTPLSNPVEADADGYFPVIYLDGGGPDYRVRLTDLDDVQVWQKDNYLAAQRESVNYRIRGDNPELILEESDAAPNEDKWVIKAVGGVLTLAVRNTAESVDVPFLTVTRSGAALTGVTIGSPLTVGSQLLTETSGYTGTLTGCTTSPTSQITAYRTGNLVTLYSGGSLTGTSNTNAMSITGMPLALRPANPITQLCRVIDNGTQQLGTVQVTTAGTVTFGLGAVSDFSGFTSSGTKGIFGSWAIVYDVSP